MGKELEITILVAKDQPAESFEDPVGKVILYLELRKIKQLLLERGEILPEEFQEDIRYAIAPRREPGEPTVIIYNKNGFLLYPPNLPQSRGGSYIERTNTVLYRPY